MFGVSCIVSYSLPRTPWRHLRCWTHFVGSIHISPCSQQQSRRCPSFVHSSSQLLGSEFFYLLGCPVQWSCAILQQQPQGGREVRCSIQRGMRLDDCWHAPVEAAAAAPAAVSACALDACPQRVVAVHVWRLLSPAGEPRCCPKYILLCMDALDAQVGRRVGRGSER
jgi:hypothetical protein